MNGHKILYSGAVLGSTGTYYVFQMEYSTYIPTVVLTGLYFDVL